MANLDPTSLDRLHDIIVPGPAPWWPPAPGWDWVSGFIFVAALLILLQAWVRRQRNCYRREALAELSRLESSLCDPAACASVPRELSELLKRAAVTAFPRETVAGMTGPAWFAFLDRTGQTAAFSAGNGAILEKAVYDMHTAVDLDEAKTGDLISRVRYWLEHHRVEAASGENG